MIHGYVARSTKDRSIIGFVWTAKTNKDPAKQSVMGLGRSPGACRLAIGESLMRQLIESHPKVELTLQVRESNTPARLLYEKLGFEGIKGVKGYYSYPTEDGINMELNRAQYQPLPVEDVV
jgi:ribosomal-protein-alanine N-acetyltransferase